MRTEKDYFIIEKSHLKDKVNFPFQLFIYNEELKKFSLFLAGNQPLTKDHLDFLDYILERGGKLAVLRNQKRTFITSQAIPESEIPSLKERNTHPLEQERLINIKLKEIHEEKNGIFSLQKEFKKILEKEDFTNIINAAKMEIITFSTNSSPTISFATFLAKNYLSKDNFINRVVSLSFYLAKNLNIQDEDSLADIVVGAYLSQVGVSQIPLTLARKKQLKMTDQEKLLYRKHSILGHHLVKKTQIILSERCKKIILDHHERTTGGGYPHGKSREQIDYLSQIVGIVSHILEFSSGQISGDTRPLKSVIHAIKIKNYQAGLEFDFEDSLFQSIITLVDSNQNELPINSKAA